MISLAHGFALHCLQSFVSLFKMGFWEAWAGLSRWQRRGALTGLVFAAAGGAQLVGNTQLCAGAPSDMDSLLWACMQWAPNPFVLSFPLLQLDALVLRPGVYQERWDEKRDMQLAEELQYLLQPQRR